MFEDKGCQNLLDYVGIYVGTDPEPKYGGKGCLQLYVGKECSDEGDPSSVTAVTLEYKGESGVCPREKCSLIRSEDEKDCLSFAREPGRYGSYIVNMVR